MPVIGKANQSTPQRAFLSKIAQAQATRGTWFSGMAIITNVQVQAGDEQMVGGLFHIKVLKVLAEPAAAAAAAALAATKCLGPGLLGTGSRWGDLHATERKTRRPNPERLLCKLF